MSVREYEARRDLFELHSLVDAGTRPSEIARIMGKDPAWVSRSIRRLREDKALVFRMPDEGKVILTTIARLESLYQKASQAVATTSGATQLAAIKTAMAVMQQLTNYQIRVGIIEERRRSAPFDTEVDGLLCEATLTDHDERGQGPRHRECRSSAILALAEPGTPG